MKEKEIQSKIDEMFKAHGRKYTCIAEVEAMPIDIDKNVIHDHPELKDAEGECAMAIRWPNGQMHLLIEEQFDEYFVKTHNYIDRIEKEKMDLYRRIKKLRLFQRTDDHESMHVSSKILLEKQIGIMEDYINILVVRQEHEIFAREIRKREEVMDMMQKMLDDADSKDAGETNNETEPQED